MFFVSRFNTTMFSLIFINFFTRFEIWYCECCWKNVSSNDEKKKKNHYWWLMKKLKEQKLWSRSNERWWKKTFWKSWKKNVLKILTKILTTILKTILKARILWIQNSLIYTSFFFLDLILNCFANKHFKLRLNITHFFRNFDLSDEEIENDVDEKNEKNLRARFLIDDIMIFFFRSFISSYSSRSTSHWSTNLSLFAHEAHHANDESI
jgi:hypothetical protein